MTDLARREVRGTNRGLKGSMINYFSKTRNYRIRYLCNPKSCRRYLVSMSVTRDSTSCTRKRTKNSNHRSKTSKSRWIFRNYRTWAGKNSRLSNSRRMKMWTTKRWNRRMENFGPKFRSWRRRLSSISYSNNRSWISWKSLRLRDMSSSLTSRRKF